MAVTVEINVRDLELNARLRDYASKKIAKMDRYLDILEDAKVDLTFAKSARNAEDRQVAQVTVRGKGVLLRAEERSDDIFASIDAVVDKLYRQIERYKGKRWRRRGDGRSTKDALTDFESPLVDDDEQHKIVRRKMISLTPMDEEEAIEQMALLDHQVFFVFLNVTTNQVNVIYRRLDGTFGLIESERG
jgi:putative sigma-54 modulation protein